MNRSMLFCLAAIAVPGDVIVLWGTAMVYGAALAAGYAELYQVAIQIPARLANGDYRQRKYLRLHPLAAQFQFCIGLKRRIFRRNCDKFGNFGGVSACSGLFHSC